VLLQQTVANRDAVAVVYPLSHGSVQQLHTISTVLQAAQLRYLCHYCCYCTHRLMPLAPDTSAAKRLKSNKFEIGSIGSSSMMLSPLPGFACSASPSWSAISGVSGTGDSPYDYSKANRYKVHT
jgi:hypothetical protein